MSDMFRYALNELQRRKGRSFWNILGYVAAVAFLLLALSFSGISSRGTGSVLEYTGAQFIGFLYATSDEGTEIRFRNPYHEGLFVYNYPVVPFPVELVDVIKESPNVRHASPLITFSLVTDMYVDRSWLVAGFDPSDMEAVRMAACSDTEIVDGDLLVPGDNRKVLLEQTFADAEQYQAGDIMYLGDYEFTVKGILSPGTRPVKADIYMPFVEAMELLNTRVEEPVRNVANVVLVDGASSLLNARAQNDVREILGFNSSTVGYGCFNPAGKAIGITARGMRMLGLIVFTGIALLILASQYYNIIARRTDIGVLKAIGWSDRNVIMQVISESFIQAFAGVVGGIIVAVMFFVFFPVGSWLGLDETFAFSLDIPVVIAGGLLTIITGVIAGIFAAMMSLRLKPASILRML